MADGDLIDTRCVVALETLSDEADIPDFDHFLFYDLDLAGHQTASCNRPWSGD